VAASRHYGGKQGTKLETAPAESIPYGRNTSVGIFLGIDGGGTKTTCVIGNETSMLGTGTAAGSNVVRLGEAKAQEALAAAIREACAAANISPAQISRTCVGLAGAGRLEISNLVRRILTELVSGEIEVVGDMMIALQAAFGSGAGVMVIAGTGSMAYGRNASGNTLRAGGWGFSIFDEGSGHWIGRSAIAALMRNYDETGEENSVLWDSVKKSWGLTTREQLVLAANASPSPDFAALLPAVLSAADSGNAQARSILTQAGTELARLAKIVIRRLFSDGDNVPVAMTGGVFSNCALVRQVFCTSLRSEYPNCSVNPAMIEPVQGALELARKGARV
jgi:glucosamine kinase